MNFDELNRPVLITEPFECEARRRTENKLEAALLDLGIGQDELPSFVDRLEAIVKSECLHHGAYIIIQILRLFDGTSDGAVLAHALNIAENSMTEDAKKCGISTAALSKRVAKLKARLTPSIYLERD